MEMLSFYRQNPLKWQINFFGVYAIHHVMSVLVNSIGKQKSLKSKLYI